VRRRLALRRVPVVTGAAVLALASLATAVAPVRAYTVWFVTLTGDQEVPAPGDADGDGLARVSMDAGDGDPGSGQFCVRWDVLDIEAATSAEVGQGEAGDAGTVLFEIPAPDADGVGEDCASGLDPAQIQSIIDDPEGFFLNVRNDAFPNGAVRGQIEAFDVTQVEVSKQVCPADIQTPADLEAAGFSTCLPAARDGDIGSPPAGHVFDPKPLEFDMQVELVDPGGTLTLDDADIEGGGSCGPTTCTMFRSYL